MIPYHHTQHTTTKSTIFIALERTFHMYNPAESWNYVEDDNNRAITEKETKEIFWHYSFWSWKQNEEFAYRR